MRKHILAALAVLALITTITADAQTQQPAKPAEQKPRPSEAEIAAQNDKRRAMQWYVIEPMIPCIAGSAKRMREEGEEPLDVRYGRYKFRLDAVTFEELTGLDPKSTDDLSPNLKGYLKLQIATDLLEMWRKGACKESSGSSSTKQ